MKRLIFLLSVTFLWSCSNDEPYPESYYGDFSFEKRKSEIRLYENTDHVYLIGMIENLGPSMSSSKTLKIIPELTTANETQYSLPDSLVFHFYEGHHRDSIKININPNQIKTPVSIAFTIENLSIDRDHSQYIDSTIIHIIPD